MEPPLTDAEILAKIQLVLNQAPATTSDAAKVEWIRRIVQA